MDFPKRSSTKPVKRGTLKLVVDKNGETVLKRDDTYIGMKTVLTPNHPTEFQPFSFEDREKKAKEAKEEKIAKIIKEQENELKSKRKFQARPVPAYLSQNKRMVPTVKPNASPKDK